LVESAKVKRPAGLAIFCSRRVLFCALGFVVASAAKQSSAVRETRIASALAFLQ
jgi:hypothetical protein